MNSETKKRGEMGLETRKREEEMKF